MLQTISRKTIGVTMNLKSHLKIEFFIKGLIAPNTFPATQMPTMIAITTVAITKRKFKAFFIILFSLLLSRKALVEVPFQAPSKLIIITISSFVN